MGLNFYVIDLESNGLSTSKHEVNEVSIIRCSDRVQFTQFIKCDHPENSSLDALKITNKTLADLSIGDSKESVVEKVDAFMEEDGGTAENRVFLAHNASFDRRFFHALYDKVGKTCPASLWLCTMEMARKYAKNNGIVKPKVNLHAACDLLGVKKLAEKHSSKMDTRNTYLLYKALIEKIDYLPFIKNAVHNPKSSIEDNMDLLDETFE